MERDEINGGEGTGARGWRQECNVREEFRQCPGRIISRPQFTIKSGFTSHFIHIGLFDYNGFISVIVFVKVLYLSVDGLCDYKS